MYLLCIFCLLLFLSSKNMYFLDALQLDGVVRNDCLHAHPNLYGLPLARHSFQKNVDFKGYADESTNWGLQDVPNPSFSLKKGHFT